MPNVKWGVLCGAAALAALLAGAAPASAAASCTEWKKVGEFWFMRCVDDKKKAVCFTCRSKQVNTSCKTQEGPICSSR